MSFWLSAVHWPGIFVLRAGGHLTVWLGWSYNGSSDASFGTPSNLLSAMDYLEYMVGFENVCCIK